MKGINNKLKSMMIALAVGALTFSSGAAANSFCPAPLSSSGLFSADDFSAAIDSWGGVTLNETLTLLNHVENIRGATYDPVLGEVIFVGEGVVDEPIDKDDLVVAMQSVFAMHQDPGVTFYTADRSRAFQTGLWDVTYFGAVKNRSFGRILFDADYVLKQLTLGIDPSGTPLRDKFPQLVQLNYQSFAERLLQESLRPRDNNDNPLAIQFWFRPQSVTLAKTDDESDDTAFVFREVSMEVVVEILDATGQEADPASYDSRLLEYAEALAAHITDNYSAYAEIADFSALKKLQRLGKITALVRWLRDSGIPVDMSFMRDYQPETASTPPTVQILQVCKDAVGGGIDAQSSGPYSWDLLCNMQIQGGITYDLENDYLTSGEVSADEVADLNALTTNLSDGRAVNPVDIAQKMKWTPTDLNLSGAGTDLLAVAQTLARSEKDGNYNFTSVDLGFPNQAGQPLAFTRYYDSFSNVSGRFGPGWSELPFELQFVGGRIEYVEEDDSGAPVRVVDENNPPSIAFPQIMVIDRLTGKMVPFHLAGEIKWENNTEQSYYSAYYLSDRSNDTITEHVSGGLFLYEQRDDNDRVLKQVYFRERAYDNVTLFYAIPTHVGTPTGRPEGDGGTTNDGWVWLEYIYDEDIRLKAIEAQNGQQIHLSYNGDRIDRVWYQSSAGIRQVGYQYDNGRLSRVSRSGGDISYAYHPQTGVIQSVRDELRGETIVEIGPDLESRVHEAKPEGKDDLRQTVTYDRVNGITTREDELGRTTVIKRDADLRLKRIERTATLKTGVADTLTTHMVYDDVANPAWSGPAEVYDVRNNKTEYGYDDAGRVTTITDALNRTTTIEYGIDAADGLPVVVTTDAKTRESLRKYDEQGRLKESYRRVDISNRAPSADDPDVTAFSFAVAPGFEAYKQVVEYDSVSGSLASISNAASQMAGDYSWIGGDESIQVVDRNEFGQVKEVQSAAGYKTVSGYDGLARKVSVQGPADTAPVQVAYYESGVQQDAVRQITTPVGTVKKTYDVANRQSSTTDARGVTTTKFYNRKNQLVRVVEISPDNESVLTTRYFYDDFGKLDYKLLPNGTQVDYEYDGFDRIVAMNERDGTDVTVSPASPIISAQPPQLDTAEADIEKVVDIDASSSVEGGVSYYLVSGPDGMEISSSTGIITWTPTTSQNSAEPYTVVVQVVGADGGITDVQFELLVGGTLADGDGDSVADSIDNCVNVINQDQRDTDNDGIGNACDADFNNDGVVNFADMAVLKSWYGTNDVDADLDGNGTVGVEDLDVLKQQFGKAPGPSAMAK